jgi:hypothetical protein
MEPCRDIFLDYFVDSLPILGPPLSLAGPHLHFPQKADAAVDVLVFTELAFLAMSSSSTIRQYALLSLNLDDASLAAGYNSRQLWPFERSSES